MSGELERTRDAAASALTEAHAQLAEVERTSALRALEAAAEERAGGDVAIAFIGELAILDDLGMEAIEQEVEQEVEQEAEGDETAEETEPSDVAALASPPSAAVQTAPTAMGTSRIEQRRPRKASSPGKELRPPKGSREEVELALMRAHSELAEHLERAAMALAAEAEAKGQLELAEGRRLAEADAARRQIATLQTELQQLARLSSAASNDGGVAQGGKGGKDGTPLQLEAVIPATLAALSPAQMRSELASQYNVLREMGEALEAAEERVRRLERWKDLAQLAEDVDGPAASSDITASYIE